MTAYYVAPDPTAAGGEAYWIEGYAVGDAKLAAVATAGVGGMDMGAVRVRESGNLTQAASTSLIGGTRVRFSGLASGANVTSLFGGNRVVARCLIQEGGSANLTGVTRVRFTAIVHEGTVTSIISGRKKWEPEPAPSNVYTDVAAAPTGLWVDVADATPDLWLDSTSAGDSQFVSVPDANAGQPDPWTDA